MTPQMRAAFPPQFVISPFLSGVRWGPVHSPVELPCRGGEDGARVFCAGGAMGSFPLSPSPNSASYFNFLICFKMAGSWDDSSSVQRKSGGCASPARWIPHCEKRNRTARGGRGGVGGWRRRSGARAHRPGKMLFQSTVVAKIQSQKLQTLRLRARYTQAGTVFLEMRERIR